MDIETLNTDALLNELRQQFKRSAEGLIGGRMALRDAVSKRLRCTKLEAEELVDMLVLRSSIKMVYRADDPPVWQIAAPH
jgi:hypothetical protein